jgi:hypothetical protein
MNTHRIGLLINNQEGPNEPAARLRQTQAAPLNRAVRSKALVRACCPSDVSQLPVDCLLGSHAASLIVASK